MSYRVVIPTAGVGSRLLEQTQHINKSLINISNKPVISHIIESFPKDVEFVIALGHKGNLVKDYINLTYSNRIFFFKKVFPYKGKGSGLGLSLILCKKYLNEPFIFVSCDTIVKGKIPEPTFNWVGYSEKKEVKSYRCIHKHNDKVLNFVDKGKAIPGIHKAYIGLAGVKDYKDFWLKMKEIDNKKIEEGEVFGLRSLLKLKIKPIKYKWYDTGNPVTLRKTTKELNKSGGPNILSKKNEDIWFANNLVIKYSNDKNFINNRVKRAKVLKGFVPRIRRKKNNMYVYNYVKGNILSSVINRSNFRNLLAFSKNFWKEKKLKIKDRKKFIIRCNNFYKRKTFERVRLFYKKFNKQDGKASINNSSMLLLKDIFKKIDWKWISNGIPGRSHGDYHFENIISSKKSKKFVLLDWRQDFAGYLNFGDIYYDLAKLMHGIIVSHEFVVKKKFKISWNFQNIKFNMQRSKNHKICQKIFEKWILENGYDLKKVRILTAIIYLNIAALHHYPYSLLLFALGKSMLHKEIIKN